MSARGLLARRVIPSAVISLSRIDSPARARAAARRRLGRPGRVELYFAFDDPCSAIAVLDLAERVRGRDVELALRPVVRRGIPGDPAREQKRTYAIVDARRLAARSGLVLGRDDPVDPEATAFLAEWAAPAAPERFCVEALRRVWFDGHGPLDEARFRDLWTGEPAPDPEAVRRNERLMRRRGPYDTPAAWLHGRWYFAHDRLVQIGERFDELGWRTR
ncbi:MAG TPA: hypothetical protein VFL87_03610 [Thermoleophilaceae bacterium]|nr:hypothetical protein [Thermoleophilaceae bacterium]